MYARTLFMDWRAYMTVKYDNGHNIFLNGKMILFKKTRVSKK